MASPCCADSALDVVKILEDKHGFKSHALFVLKVDLRSLRTFQRCHCRKWSINNDDDDKTCLFQRVEDVVRQIESCFNSLLHEINDGITPQPQGQSYEVFLKFSYTIDSFSKEISGFYRDLLDRMYMSSSNLREPSRDEVMKLLDSVLDHTREKRPYDDVEKVMEDIEEKVGFLQNMIQFAWMFGVEDDQTKDLLFHTDAVAVRLAQLFHENAYIGVERFYLKVFDLVLMIKPVRSPVCDTYTHVLSVCKPSGCLRFDVRIFWSFMDSVRGSLWEILCPGSHFLDPVKDEVKLMYDGLSFFSSILREKKELEYDDLKVVVDIVIDAGILSCYLFATEMNECHNLALSDLIKRMEFVKSEIVSDKCAVNYPRTDVLGFINLLLQNIEELRCNESLVDQIETVHEDLTLVAEIVQNCNQNEEGVQLALFSHAIDVVYKVDFFIDSLLIRDNYLHYSPVLLSEISQGINLLKLKASNIDFQFSNHSNKVESQVNYSTSTPIIDDVVVGLEDSVEETTNLVTRGTSELDVVSIVGMAGLGKTTLAKRVYNDAAVMFHFHVRAWSCVSQRYYKHALLLDILEKVFEGKLPPGLAEKNEDDLTESLYKFLKGKRYLIILDDVWDTAVWKDLGQLFPNDYNGSRILFTTRILDVALHANSKVHSLRSLADHECLDLLRKKLSLHPTEEDLKLGVQIAKTCKGLPFSVLVLSGILVKMERHLWTEVVESLSSRNLYGTEQSMSTLELSYNHLPGYLKPCLLYLGLFPEDQEVSASKLMWLWIAEGFVLRNSDTKSLEDAAEDYMMDLRGRSLITVAQQSSLGGRVKSCSVHDLVHEFCMAKSKEENFCHVLQDPDELRSFYEPRGLRRLCVLSEPESLRKSRLFCTHIRSLSFFNSDKSWHARNPCNVTFLFHFSKLLKVLNLGKVKLGEIFPAEIELLVLLRYLAICGDMDFIPSSISRLRNLETFLIEGISENVLLPDTIWDMKKLRHLHVHKRVAFTSTPYPEDSTEVNGNYGLYNVDTFSTALIVPETEKILQFFPNLRRLKCSVSESWDCDGIQLHYLTRLESLRIIATNKVLDAFEFGLPENLKKLTLSQFLLPWSKISVIGGLPNLEVLKLLSDAFVGETWDMEEGSFPKLKFLKLEFMDLVAWTAEAFSDSLLETLVLRNCSNLEDMPDELREIPSLKMVEVYRCRHRLADMVAKIQKEQQDLGNEDLKIIVHASTLEG